MKEQNIQTLIQKAISKHTTATMFRNNTFKAWIGQTRQTDKGMHIANPRRIEGGLCVGSSDLIGWTSKTITSDMVGKKIAIFTALEVKTPIGRIRPEQTRFVNAVVNAGGIAGFPRSESDAVDIVNTIL